MIFSIAALRAEAAAIGHAIGSEVIAFIDHLEAKQARLDADKAELEAAGYTVQDPPASPARAEPAA
jgi:hypothetical protein